ncbi:MAG: NAD(P)/FAD-dependent oxidoreductase [Proteobacteria bacterium]|nr:NAD(P)/FAD-dependent oxidoreductase [Pseudomonadota bacterium]MBU1737939.1 NAD(P)/FAD-dependent oxidoreductase [Pseudomonadota bacterium]
MTAKKIIVIGGGPSGLMAAGQAALAGAEVLLLEKMKRPGRKLCISGKGRCNITNIADKVDFMAHFGRSGRFLHQAFARFFNTELLDFLHRLGLETVAERGGRVFPKSGKAHEVLDALLAWVESCGVKISSSSPVDDLLIEDGKIVGVRCGSKTISCRAVILATGGASYPATGSTGDGYRMAEKAGHTIKEIRPALIPLETAGSLANRLAGLDLRNIRVRTIIDGKRKKELFGEMSFTRTGVSGPVILTLSGEIVDHLQRGAKIELAIDLKPALDEQKLDARLQRDIASRGKESVESMLRGLLPKEMIPVCLEQTEIAGDKQVHTISAQERKTIRNWLKELRLEVTGHRPIKEAIVTAGGVNTKEIDPNTMESKLVRGLYITGELLDIQGDTGGYNLQAAFSTGWLAGRAAAAKQDPVLRQ